MNRQPMAFKIYSSLIIDRVPYVTSHVCVEIRKSWPLFVPWCIIRSLGAFIQPILPVRIDCQRHNSPPCTEFGVPLFNGPRSAETDRAVVLPERSKTIYRSSPNTNYPYRKTKIRVKRSSATPARPRIRQASRQPGLFPMGDVSASFLKPCSQEPRIRAS